MPAIALVPTGAMGQVPARAPGFDRYLAKPVGASELRAAVAELARR